MYTTLQQQHTDKHGNLHRCRKIFNFRATEPDCSKLFELVSSTFEGVNDQRFRHDPRDFSRGGTLDPKLLITLLLYRVADSNRRGYRHLLEGFWDEARGLGLPLPSEAPVSAPSFCAARPKITPDLLRHMLHELATNALGDGHAEHFWHGRRVFAVDGAKINLQRSPDPHSHFGTPAGSHCPQLLVSVLLDVRANLPVDLVVAPYASSEREHLLAMIPSLAPGDVLTLDRGYPSHEVLQELVAAEIDFLVRVPSTSTFAVIDSLRASGERDIDCKINPPPGSPSEWRSLELRAVRVKAPGGAVSYFLTSLKRAEFTTHQLGELYHLRWQIEEFFKLLQGSFIGQQQFRSKSPSGVRQELHALVLFVAITRLCMSTTASASGVCYEELSQKAAVLGLAAYLTRIFLPAETADPLQGLALLLQRIARATERKRAGRRFLRRSFKPTPRWGSTGRRGA